MAYSLWKTKWKIVLRNWIFALDFRILRKIIFVFVIIGTFFSIKTSAQANFSRIGFGISGGLTSSFSGLTYGLSPIIPGYNPVKTLAINKSRVFGGSLDYFFTPFINAGIEYNSVQLKDGTDKHNRAFISTFSSIELRGTVSAGEFIDFSYSPFLYAIRNVNAGLGLGFISGSNNVANFGSGTFPSRQHAGDLGKSEFSGVVSIPISIGYNLNIYDVYQETRFVIGANYKMSFTTSDDIDGYSDDPSIFENQNKDVYTSFTISVKYLFGPKGLYIR